MYIKRFLINKFKILYTYISIELKPSNISKRVLSKSNI